MKHLTRLDRAITNRIRTGGQSTYVFWNWLATKSIAIFVVVACVLAWLGQLVFWKFAVVFVLSYVVAVCLQHFIRRPRPNFEKLTGYKMWIETYSCPSAHATMSAAAVTSITMLTSFSNAQAAGVVIAGSMALAVLIGLSRIMVGVHYLADVIFGWLLGFVVALGYVLLLVM